MSDDSKSSVPGGKQADRYGLLFFAVLYTFFFVGALFGWGPMQRLMEASGAFHSKCNSEDVVGDVDDDEDGVCDAQATTIINVNFIAICTNTLTPFIGQAIDHYGAPKVATVFMAPCALLGTGLLVLAAGLQVDFLYYVAFCSLGLATFSGSLLSVQVGLYFTGTMQVRIIMLLNALFDAGSVTYLILWGLQSFFGLSFFQVVSIYFLLALIEYGGGVYFWNSAVPEEEESEETQQLLSERKGEFEKVRESLREYQAARMENAEDIGTTLRSYRGGGALVGGSGDGYGATTTIDEEKVGAGVDDGYVLIADRPPQDQILSLPFIMMTLFFAINMISTNWSLTTAADFLAALGDNGKYLSLFTLMQPASVLALPLVDATVNYLGFDVAFQMVNLLSFIYILIKLTVLDLNIQIIHFVLVAVVRCYLFAVSFSFLPRLLGADVVGKGTGLLYMVGGVFSFINIPLAGLSSNGNFGFTNTLYLACTIPTTLMAYYLGRTIKQEERIKSKAVTGKGRV